MSTRITIIFAIGLLLIATVLVGEASAHGKNKWHRLAHCESTHRWHINTGNGYYGGLQISKRTWDAYRNGQFAKYPHRARPKNQVVVARRILNGQGWGAWPGCKRVLIEMDKFKPIFPQAYEQVWKLLNPP